MVQAVTTVHTSGINWQSLAAILAGFAAIAGVLLAWTERRQSGLKNQIADSVNHLSDVLMARLETKEAVAALRVEVIQSFNLVNVKIARLEGIQRISDADDAGSVIKPLS